MLLVDASSEFSPAKIKNQLEESHIPRYVDTCEEEAQIALAATAPAAARVKLKQHLKELGL